MKSMKACKHQADTPRLVEGEHIFPFQAAHHTAAPLI
jgi:hypothetical protein